MNKKVYQHPETLKVALEPQCIICTSPGGGFVDPNMDFGGPAGGFGGA
jgi:hypothetical protein